MESRNVTYADQVVSNGISTMPRVLDECVFDKYADGHDPDISGKRNKIQEQRHLSMYSHLVQALAFGSVG